MHRSSPFRSTLNTNVIKVCTEAVHSVAVWTRTLSQLWACVKYVPKQSIPYSILKSAKMRIHANAKARKLENAWNAKTQKTRKRRKRENAESAKTQKTRKRRKRENAKTRNTQSKQRNAKNDQTSHGRRTEMQNTNKRKHENAKTRKRFSRFSRFLGFLVFSVFSFSRFSRFLVFSFRWPHPCGHVAFFMCLDFHRLGSV